MMISRKIDKEFEDFYASDRNKALLVTGARQVGKTYSIREFARTHFDNFIEINFLENKSAEGLFANASDAGDILLRISALADAPMVPGKTLIFFDEVQVAKDIITAIKFLVEEGSYKYILSGSMLGVELKDIRSVPVGYMDIIEMFPLDFEEFIMANGVSKRIIDVLSESFEFRKPIDEFIHKRMMSLFELYLIVGGMPAAVNVYLRTNNLKDVIKEQKNIIQLYKMDIGQYDPEHKLYLEEIFELIPSELNAQNKRFILKNLNEHMKFSRYENSFIWLKEAGVALPVFCASEPTVPLKLSSATNLFKLFMSDVGLLASTYMNGIQIKILNHETEINFGSVYENAVAEELKAHGYELYYFKSKKQGELDFVIEDEGTVLPLEVKSGKNYKKHVALSNVMGNRDYNIPRAFVLHNGNVETAGNITYYPIYFVMFIKRDRDGGDMIYKPDLRGLQ